jgi:hypothetical protein
MTRDRTLVLCLALGAPVGVAAAACTLIVPAEEAQCSTAADCVARGAAFVGAVCSNHVCVTPPDPADGDTADVTDAGAVSIEAGPWSCLDLPPQVVDPNARVEVEIRALDALKPLTPGGATGGSDLTIIAGTPFPGVRVQACTVLDPSCTAPVTAAIMTDDAGFGHFTVQGDFAGFYELTRDDLLPTTLYPGQLVAGELKAETPAPLLGNTGVAALATAIGVPFIDDPDAGVGHLFINAFDCEDRHAPGVSFTISSHGPQTTSFYTKGGFPSTSADRTDGLGAGGAVNVPIGLATVSAMQSDTKRPLGSISVVIRSRAATFAWIRMRAH